jgi:hypothetical protein
MEKKILALMALGGLLFFLSYALRKRKLLSNILMTAVSVLVTLLVIEFGYRTFIKKKDATDKMHPFSLYIADSLLGYKNNQPALYTVLNSFPNGDTVYNTTYSILDDTISAGIHFNFRKGYRSDSCNKEVVFLGCSLTFGQGLTDTQSLPYRFGEAANVSTLNMACIGYGIHQVYQLFNSKFSGQNNQDRIFIYSFFYDHILRANGIYGWNNAGPFFDIEHDTLVNRGPLYKYKWLKGDKLAFNASLFGAFKVIKDNLHKAMYREAAKNLSEADYKRCFIMLQEMAKKINSCGGRFIILDWANYNWFYKPLSDISKSKIDQQLGSLSKLGVQVIPVASLLNMSDSKNFIPIDGHPSAAANKTIANWLAAHTTFTH